MTRVLIVDDSATMRGLIRARLLAEEGIFVVGEAASAHEARTAIKRLDPDVVTLDVEMPSMNGLEFLEKIMRLRPTPVVMVSSHTEAGATATLRALEIGAVECIAKPTNSGDRGFDLLPAAIRNAARARLRPWSAPEPRAPAATNALYRPDGRIVAIGSSTGGVEALIEVVSGLPANCPPTVITQHMPPLFTKSLASRLDRLSAASVAEATDGAPLEAGRVFLAPGGAAHLTVAGGSTPRCRLSPGEAVNGHRPSVDVLFHSVARASRSCVGIILIGMGRDGAEGLRAIRQAGGTTFGQDEASSVVYGMPKIAFELGAVERQLPLRRITQELLTATNALDRETP